MGGNSGGIWRESNGHDNGDEGDRGGGGLSQVLGGTGERGGLIKQASERRACYTRQVGARK
jgi:hypothetical protein